MLFQRMGNFIQRRIDRCAIIEAAAFHADARPRTDKGAALQHGALADLTAAFTTLTAALESKLDVGQKR